jgi:hypothetical protein
MPVESGSATGFQDEPFQRSTTPPGKFAPPAAPGGVYPSAAPTAMQLEAVMQPIE